MSRSAAAPASTPAARVGAVLPGLRALLAAHADDELVLYGWREGDVSMLAATLRAHSTALAALATDVAEAEHTGAAVVVQPFDAVEGVFELDVAGRRVRVGVHARSGPELDPDEIALISLSVPVGKVRSPGVVGRAYAVPGDLPEELARVYMALRGSGLSPDDARLGAHAVTAPPAGAAPGARPSSRRVRSTSAGTP